MPPDRQPPQKRRRLPFNPPRMQSPTVAGPSSAAAPSSSKPKSTTATATKATKTTKPRAQSKTTKASSSSSFQSASKHPAARKQKQKQPPTTEEASDNDDASDASSSASSGGSAQRDRYPSQEPDYILAEITHGEEQGEDVALGEPTIPPKLLTKLLHHHFQNEKTKIAKDANEVVAKYVDVFVREALARAAYERSEGTGAPGSASAADGFLEVEDLEKMAPQLVLDF